MEFSMELSKYIGRACVYRGFRKKIKKIPSASQWNANGTFNGTFISKSMLHMFVNPATEITVLMTNHLLPQPHIGGEGLVFSDCTIQ